MEVVETPPAQPAEEKKQEKPLSREQRRIIDRVNREAHERLGSLVEHFFEFFMEHDPQSVEVEDKKKEVSAKWKMYVHNRRLSKEALNLCEEKCDELIAQYLQFKQEKKEETPVE